MSHFFDINPHLKIKDTTKMTQVSISDLKTQHVPLFLHRSKNNGLVYVDDRLLDAYKITGGIIEGGCMDFKKKQ